MIRETAYGLVLGLDLLLSHPPGASVRGLDS
jgi:hypothetical protein